MSIAIDGMDSGISWCIINETTFSKNQKSKIMMMIIRMIVGRLFCALLYCIFFFLFFFGNWKGRMDGWMGLYSMGEGGYFLYSTLCYAMHAISSCWEKEKEREREREIHGPEVKDCSMIEWSRLTWMDGWMD